MNKKEEVEAIASFLKGFIPQVNSLDKGIVTKTSTLQPRTQDLVQTTRKSINDILNTQYVPPQEAASLQFTESSSTDPIAPSISESANEPFTSTPTPPPAPVSQPTPVNFPSNNEILVALENINSTLKDILNLIQNLTDGK